MAEEFVERGNWTGKLDFLLSCLGYAVGLGNVWRFPYLCFKHGGGAFLIPYAIMLMFIGIPCFFLEISIGQYSAMGPVTTYSNLSPLFKGLGFSNFFASAFVGLYYNMIIAWSIFYLFSSFTSELPWASCNNEFNDERCFSINDYKDCIAARENGTIIKESIYIFSSCISDPEKLAGIRENFTEIYKCNVGNKTHPVDGVYTNLTHCGNLTDARPDKLFDTPLGLRETAAAQYLNLEMLDKSDGIANMGPVKWDLALCLLAAWIIIFFCLIKGIKSSGKVVYFTATFPYLVLLILLIKAATLPGAIEGIRFYIVPDFSKLSDISVWEGAAVQIFYSLSVAGGGLITLASYNKFHNNVLRDTMIVCFGNCFTSIFAGFAIFSIIGFMAHELGVKVEDVAIEGTGLAFVAYPDLVTRLPWAPFWSFLFFSMLLTLGLDSQFAIVETILTGILDFMPQLRPKKTYIVGGVCVIGYICGLPLATRGGSYLLGLLDYYAAGWPYLFIGFCELIIIGHIYGIDNFLDDIYSIMKLEVQGVAKTIFTLIYRLVSPLIILIILIVSWATYKPLESGDYVYPGWSNAIGFIIAFGLILAVPAVAVYQVASKSLKSEDEKPKTIIKNLLEHTPMWRENALRATNADKPQKTEDAGYDNKAMNMES